MFLNNIEIKGKSWKDLSIDLDDEYSYMDYYRDSESNSNYNYIKRKYDNNSLKHGKYVGLYKNKKDKLGYFYISLTISTKPIFKYPSYTRYAELLEFGFINNDLEAINFLLDYLIEYAANNGSYFIKIKTKEKAFSQFYELLRKHKHYEDENYIYLEFKPIEYNFAKYLNSYENDKLSIKELYRLNSIGFQIEKEICKYKLHNNDFIIVDRKTRKVSYPKKVINLTSKYSKLNQNSFNLIHIIINIDNNHENKVIDVNYKLEKYEFDFVKVDNELWTLDNLIYDKTHIKNNNILIEIAKKSGINILYICNQSKYKFKTFYESFSYSFVNLANLIK